MSGWGSRGRTQRLSATRGVHMRAPLGDGGLRQVLRCIQAQDLTEPPPVGPSERGGQDASLERRRGGWRGRGNWGVRGLVGAANSPGTGLGFGGGGAPGKTGGERVEQVCSRSTGLPSRKGDPYGPEAASPSGAGAREPGGASGQAAVPAPPAASSGWNEGNLRGVQPAPLPRSRAAAFPGCPPAPPQPPPSASAEGGGVSTVQAHPWGPPAAPAG